MKNKKSCNLLKKRMIFIAITLAIAFIGFVISQSNDELQNELDSLISSINSQGYGWLADYQLNDSAEIAVFEKNSDNEIARFTNITIAGKSKIYLTNLPEGEIYDTFDLKVISNNENTGVEFDYIVDPAIAPDMPILNSPANNSFINTNWTVLNATIIDPDGNSTIVYIYANNNSAGLNDSEGLVYIGVNVANNTQVTYNLTALPIKPNELTLTGLFHFDNLSQFGENTTNVYDFAGGNDNGTCSGTECPTWNASGKIAGAYKFDGVNDYISTFGQSSGRFIDLDGSTIMVWAKPTGGPATKSIVYDLPSIISEVNANYGISRGIHGNLDRIRFYILDTSVTLKFVNITYTLDEWVHITGVWNGTHISIYKNGNLTDSSSSGALLGAGSHINIGANYELNAFFNGSIDELAFWDRSLSADEIQSMYSLGEGKYYWKANASDGSLSNVSQTFEFSVDRTNPALTISLNDTQIELGIETLNLNWTSTDTNIGSAIFNITLPNGSLLFSSTAVSGAVNSTSPANLSMIGVYNISFWANDSAGNSNSTTTSFSVNDTIFPSISIITPFNNTFTSDNLIDVNYTSSDANIQSCWYSNDTMSYNYSLNNCGVNLTTVIWSEGQHNVTIWANDTANNVNSSSVRFTIDTIPSLIDFVAPTPDNEASKSATSVYINVSTSDTNNHSAFIDWNRSLVGWWNFESVGSDGIVYDNSTYCYDNETEILTLEEVNCESVDCDDEDIICENLPARSSQINEELLIENSFEISDDNIYSQPLDDLSINSDNENNHLNISKKCYKKQWKYFYELDGKEEVATLNQKTNELEYQKPLENQEFNYHGEMYNIVLEDGSNLLVSPEHRVYAASKNSLSSSVVKTLTSDCSLKCSSLDQIGMLSSNAKAKKGTSSLCEINLNTLSLNDCEEFFNVISSGSNSKSLRNFSLLIPDFEQINSEYFNISLTKFSGANNSISYSFNNLVVNDADLNKENTTLVSTTNLIYNSLDMAFLNSLPNLTHSSSVNFDFSKSFSNFSNISICRILLINASLAIDDQLSQSNLSIFCLSSSGTDNVNDVILIFSTYDMFNMYNNILQVYKFSSHDMLILSDNSSTSCSVNLDLDTTLLSRAILSNLDWINLPTNKDQSMLDVCLINTNSSGILTFISIDKYNPQSYINFTDFSLNPITDVYSKFNDNNIYFLDSENNPIKVKSITKEKYNGKIYDVDVENDVVLVRRLPANLHSQINDEVNDENNLVNNSLWINSLNNSEQSEVNVSGSDGFDMKGAVWSGNSNHGNMSGFATNTTVSGIRGKALEFDGVNDYVQMTNSPSLNITKNITISAWVNSKSFADWQSIVRNRGVAASSGGYLLYIESDNCDGFPTFSVRYQGWQMCSSYNLANNLNKWVYVTFTYNGAVGAIYINGALNGTSTFTASTTVSGLKNVTIGDTVVNAFFNGTIDEVMLWNRVLSPEEINASFNAGAYRLFRNFTGLGEGNYNYTAYAIDAGGNINTTGQRYVTVDTTAPSVNISSPLNQTYSTTAILFNITANDSSGISACGYTLNNGLTNYTMSNISIYWNATNLTMTQGSHTVRFYCNDTLGNENNSEVRIFGVDSIMPAIDLIYPLNSTYNLNISNLNYTYSDANIGVCWYSRDNGVANSSIQQPSMNFTNVISAEGSNTWKLYCNDSANNLNQTSVTFVKDTIVPQISIVAPANNTVTSDNLIDVNYTSSDANLQSCWYSNDTMSYNYSLGIGGNCANITTVIWSEGQHNITVWVNDSANNVNLSSVRFTIDTTSSLINLIYPNNNSGDNDGNLTFNYNITDDGTISNCSLVFNGVVNITNVSITKSVVQNFTLNNLAVGSYNWSVDCTDSANNLNNSVVRSFAVIPATTFSGSTTDLSQVNITNITNLVIENLNSGLINFSQSVDLSSGLDINSYVNISNNRIEINSAGASSLNKQARLTLYNLAFTDPRVLKDGSACSASICTEIGYSGGNFTFDVTGFSVYSADETPVSSSSSSSSGGGSSGGIITSDKKIEFSLDSESFMKTIVLNKIELGHFELTNNGASKQNFDIKVEVLDKIIIINETKISLEAGETGKIEFRIHAPEKTGIYTGKIVVSSGGIKKEILVAINVKTENSLFDIILSIPKSLRAISAGNNLITQINLIQMGIKEKMDVTLSYVIKDFSGKIYLTESETIAVENQKSFNREFHTEELPLGDYVLGAELIYPDGVAIASSQFSVKDKSKIGQDQMLMGILILILISMIIIILTAIKRYKRIKSHLKR